MVRILVGVVLGSVARHSSGGFARVAVMRQAGRKAGREAGRQGNQGGGR